MYRVIITVGLEAQRPIVSINHWDGTRIGKRRIYRPTAASMCRVSEFVNDSGGDIEVMPWGWQVGIKAEEALGCPTD